MARSPLDTHSGTPADLKERLEADRRGGAYVVCRDGGDAQRLFALDRDRVTIGRSEAADIALPWEPSASRHHATIERTVEGWSIVDDGLSMNGTFVNGQQIKGRRTLNDRDLIEIGEAALAFRDPVGPLTQPTMPVARPRPIELSPGQRRVLVALCRPFGDNRPYAAPATNEEIAIELVLSVDAVKTQLRALYGRFGLEDLPRAQKRTRLVERAFGTGTITSGDYA